MRCVVIDALSALLTEGESIVLKEAIKALKADKGEGKEAMKLVNVTKSKEKGFHCARGYS